MNFHPQAGASPGMPAMSMSGMGSQPVGPSVPVSQGSMEESEPETLSYNKRNIQKWEKDEPLGELATISPVLYANIQHPELKQKYPGKQHYTTNRFITRAIQEHFNVWLNCETRY